MDSPLITAVELAEKLAGTQPPVVLDVRWTLAGANQNAYLVAHIPGAQFIDLDADLAAPAGDGSLGRHPLPAADELERTWRRVGIDQRSEVVIYDAADASSSARAWWLLRWSGHPDAQVLDGGLVAWQTADLPTDSGEEPAPALGDATVTSGSVATLGVDEAAEFAARGRLLDARAAARYRGEIEPIDPVAGHIPGAVNVPFSSVVHPDGTFRSTSELREIFESAGLRPGMAATASCGSGVTACQLILAGAVAGIDLALYPGSWSQWCALGRPAETG